MTVCNEAPTLERAVQSVAPVVDEIIIGVDERSQDETLEIAHSLATRVFTFEESSPPNFARMRNRALELVETDWAIVLDGHEWIENAEVIPGALETTAWSIEVRMLFEPDEQGIPGLSFIYPKLHRRHVRFVGPTVHEEISTPTERRDLRRDIRVWHERKPGTASEARSREKSGNELAALRSAWERDGSRRALFYLANGLRESGRFEEAVSAYREYLTAPAWPEEGWQAQLYLARCLEAQGDHAAARVAFQEAVVARPERAEATVGLGYVCLAEGDFRSAAAWFRMAAALPEPEDCRLFVEVPVYRWGAWHGLALALHRLGDRAGAVEAERHALDGGAGNWARTSFDLWTAGDRWRDLFDVSVEAYYQGKPQDGRAACDVLLASEDLAPSIRIQTRRNQVFYARRLEEIVPDTRIAEIVFETRAGWTRFNPSIAASNDGYRVIVRSSNFSLDRSMRYTTRDGGPVRTENYLLDLAPNLSLRDLGPIEDATGGERFPFPVEGFEDCRFFRHRGSWFVTATTRNRNPMGTCQVALMELADRTFRDLRLLTDAESGRHEKNWVPLTHEDLLYFVYSCRPTIILRYDYETGATHEIVRTPGPAMAADFRGGSPAIELEDGFLFIVHESIDFEDGRRVVPHRFVRIDRDFRITHVSDQFYFLERTLEYCAGLARRDDVLVASFGFEDRGAYLATMPLTDVLTILRPVAEYESAR